MPLNPYFNETTFEPEQDLIQDLIDESIKIHGHETYYLRREDVDIDQLLGEDHLQRWERYALIEMYIKSSASFQGQSEFISKFGLHIEDQCTFAVSHRRFHATFPDMSRPRENDLIWLQMTPTNRYIFEIRFVENKEQLFQLGKLYTYELRCELMNYSHEVANTGIAVVDNVLSREIYTPNTAANTVFDTHDPIADNEELVTTGNTVVTVRGTNPRYS